MKNKENVLISLEEQLWVNKQTIELLTPNQSNDKAKRNQGY
jgi:hypothetical protein